MSYDYNCRKCDVIHDNGEYCHLFEDRPLCDSDCGRRAWTIWGAFYVCRVCDARESAWLAANADLPVDDGWGG